MSLTIVSAVLDMGANHQTMEEKVLNTEMRSRDEKADQDGQKVAKVVFEGMRVCRGACDGCSKLVMLLMNVPVDSWVVKCSMDSVEANLLGQETDEPLTHKQFARRQSLVGGLNASPFRQREVDEVRDGVDYDEIEEDHWQEFLVLGQRRRLVRLNAVLCQPRRSSSQVAKSKEGNQCHLTE